MIKKVKIALATSITLVSSFILFDNRDSILASNEEITTVINDNDKNIVRISALGDVMVHGPQIEAQRQMDNTYNFENNFKFIKPIIEKSDLSIANLETTINENRPLSSYPNFNSPIEVLDALKSTGIDVLSTINNHSLDTGASGVISTYNQVSSKGFDIIGTKLNESDNNYTIKNIKGINIGLASFSYGEVLNGEVYLNGIPGKSSRNLLNVIDVTSVERSFNTIKKEIDLMKSNGAEFIVLVLHWGKEYETEPNNYQKKLAQKLADEGVDVILGSHPHVVQPIEFIKSNNTNKETLVVYSMGNIISNQRNEYMESEFTEDGIIPVIDIKKENNEVSIINIQYVPTWVNKYTFETEKKDVYEIIPLHKDMQLTHSNYRINKEDITKSLNNTKSIITNSRIKIYS